MMPPSPRLFARSTSVTYLSETTIISDQKIAETPPRMFSAVSGMPCTGIERLLGGVQRARADVAVDDAQREKRKRRRGLRRRCDRAAVASNAGMQPCVVVHGASLAPRSAARSAPSIFTQSLRRALRYSVADERCNAAAWIGLRVGGRRHRALHAGRLRDAAALRPREHRDGLPARRRRRRAALLPRPRDRARRSCASRAFDCPLRPAARNASRSTTLQYLLTFAIMLAVALIISQSRRERAAPGRGAGARSRSRPRPSGSAARCSRRSRTTCARRWR